MPDTFTPEQIAQILEAFFAAVGTRQYIGARYVPIFGRKDETSIQWDNTAPYEPLTIVLYQGNSYTSRQYVPEGVEITNQEFWANTGNYNAQVEQYRQETAQALQVAQDASEAAGNAQQSADDAQNDIDVLLPKSAFSAENTVKEYIDEKTYSGKPINVLSLGFDNTGANDVSSLINQYTEQYDLFFPIGIYRIDETIQPKHGLYGESFTRTPITIDNQNMAIFDSHVEDNIISINGVRGITVSNIGIYCRNNENAITITGNYGSHYIHNVNIANLKNIGINVKPDLGLSRCVYIDSIVINGNSEFPNSIGLKFNNLAYDSKIENIEIMRVQKGIVTECTIYGSNIHIWGGTTVNETPSETWINNNHGLTVNNTTVIFNNFYVDTFKYMITSTGYCHVQINNIISMCDGTINYNNTSVLTNLLDDGVINITGGFIRYGNGFIGIAGIGTRRNVIMNGVTIDSSDLTVFDKVNYKRFEIAHNVYKVVPRLSTGYVHMFAIRVQYNDLVNIELHQYESADTFTFSIVNNVVTASHTGTSEFGYVYDETTHILHVYKHYTTTITYLQPFSINCDNMISFMIDIEMVTDRVRNWLFANSAIEPENYTIIANA